MEADLGRKARGLTADAKQKISLGRGMVREDVNAILFDEPLTVIDPHMKWELRTQLKSLHREFGHTMIYVTHDQTEALTFADKVVVMYDGRVVQMGTPAGTVRNARAYLRRLLHRLARHEPARCHGRGRPGAGGRATIAAWRAPTAGPRAGSRSASARNSSASPRPTACPSRSAGSRTSAATASCAPRSRAAR